MPARREIIEGFVGEDQISLRTRIENFLLVALGIKPMSLLTLPGEMLSGEQLGWRIDNLYREKLQEIQHLSWWGQLSWQLRHLGQRSVVWKRQLLSQAYQQVVEASEAYQAHLHWARAFELHTTFWEVRPTVRELYLYCSPSVEDEIEQLMAERRRIHQQARKHATKETPLSLLVYPEEQFPDYLARLGRLLGYPKCCIDAYCTDRAQGINVESRMASALQHSSEDEAPWAFFTGNFFPCSPNCQQASRLGQQAYQELAAIDRHLGEEYKRLLLENREQLRSYPEIINRHAQQVKGRSAFRSQ